MKKLFIFTMVTLVTCAVVAQGRSNTRRNTTNRRAGASISTNEEAPTTGKAAKVVIDQFPKVGRASTLSAPSLSGASLIGQCYNKPRKWIVLESKYTTYAKWHDQLTFTWHVLLDSKTATENKGNKEKLAPYSYFTTTTTYQNIPQGSHAASVCLHPSYLELFGEPKAIGLVITNAKGEVLAGDCESEIQGIKAHTMFWDDQDIMNAQQGGEPMIERRQGLVDRSKTIWALVNPNDYEMVAQ